MVWEPSAYVGGEVKVYIRHNEVDLLEVQDVEYRVNNAGRTGGAGLGHPQDRYHKFGVPKGTYRINKAWLNASEQAELFAKLIAGATAVTEETIASGASSHVCASALVSILSVVVTGGDSWTILYEGTDYTVNYATETLTFIGDPFSAAAGKILYLTDASGLATTGMDGAAHPFLFDVEWRKKSDGTVTKRLRGCAPYDHGIKSGFGEQPFTEDLSGNFLWIDHNPQSL